MNRMYSPSRRWSDFSSRHGGGELRRKTNRSERKNMLYTIAVILLVLWLLGMVSSYTVGGFIHVLLVIAIIVILLRVISGRKPL